MARKKQTPSREPLLPSVEVLEMKTPTTGQELGVAIEVEKIKRELITSYIKSQMRFGIDYGTIRFKYRNKQTGQYQEAESKPSLFKPGAEKFCSLFKLRASFKGDEQTLKMAGNPPGLFALICYLKSSENRIVGEGRGAADLKEKDNWPVNSAIKICKKRALIDAVVTTGALSDFFTQDNGEVGPQTHPKTWSDVKKAIPVQQAQTAPPEGPAESMESVSPKLLVCSDCKEPVSVPEYQYSKKNYKIWPLCRKCQGNYKKII